jgi:outer membrane protein assembly factor BamD (BamD/ComL family)
MKAFLISEEIGNKDQGLMLFKEFIKRYPTGELNDSALYMIDELEGKHPQIDDMIDQDND